MKQESQEFLLSLLEKQKNKEELLLKDLCARVPYGVKISVESWDGKERGFVDKVDVLYSVNRDGYIKSSNEDYDFSIENIKPYLFPLSSMTEEQYDEMEKLVSEDYLENIQVMKEMREKSGIYNALALIFAKSNRLVP